MTSSRRTRLTGSTLLAAAVGLVVVLDTGVVQLPFSTPRPVVAAGASAAPGGGAGSETDPAALQARDDAVAQTLEALSAALATGAPVEPLVAPGSPEVVRALGRLVRNVRAVDGATATVARERYRETTVEADGDVTVQVGMTSRLVASEPLAYDYVYTRFRRVGRQWLLSGWDPVADPNETVPDAPFLLPVDIVAVRRPHTLLLGTVGVERLAARLAGRAEGAALQAREALPQAGWDGTVVVYAFTESAFLDRVFGAHEAGLRDEHPYSWWSHETDTGVLRVVLGAGYVAVDDASSRLGVRRAVGCAAGLATDGMGVPDWMIEGTAEYVSTRSGSGVDPDAALDRRGLDDATWRAVRRGTWTPRLVGAASDNTTAAQIAAAEDSAWLACLFIADRYGEQRMQESWEAVARRRDYGEAKERAAFTALGTTRAAFVRDLRVWTRRLVARSG
ncbi:hypothetical protein [Kineosporia sp. R_H_3]|uniref:hypothetical protein n=1 Tax=Kineosporia sp. R_H_3 TaxID=1961848 RepID=UPI000B4B4511|nr:hypothetical protein [Kineosporia sp. R_H_3]